MNVEIKFKNIKIISLTISINSHKLTLVINKSFVYTKYFQQKQLIFYIFKICLN